MITGISEIQTSHAFEALLAASALILLVLAIRKPVARHFGAGVAYALWLLPLARLVLPPLPSGASVFSWLKAAPAASPETVAAPEGAVASAHVLRAHEMTAAPALPAAPATTPDLEAPAASLALPGDLLLAAGLAAFAVWAAGAIWCIARSFAAHREFMQIVDQEGTPVTGDLESLAVEVAREAKLKRMPRVVTSLISSGPFVTGLLRPAVVLPAWFAEDYTRIEARAALAHELTHVKRGDLWALQASELFVAVMWFNPLAYIARRAFRTDQEAACDADVLRRGHASPHAYGSTLVKAVRMQMPSRLALATGLPLTHALKERLKLMSYPAPDTRRRWAGFGAAVLFGTAALVGTASVAAAGEPRNRELKIQDGSVWLDGEKLENRQIVLLSDPVKDLIPDPPVPPEVTRLTMKMSKDAAELAGPEVLGAILDFTHDEDFLAITNLSAELALLGAEIGAESATEALKMSFSGMSEAEIEAWAEDFEARMEAKAANIEARAEAMEAQIERHADRLDSRIDKATQARVIAIEKRMEADSAQIEAAVQRHYGKDFENRIKARTDLIPQLVEDCAALDLKDGETRIVERKADDGASVKLACAAGGRDVLQSGQTLTFINSNSSLTEEEKQTFRDQAADGKKRTFIRTQGASEGRKVHVIRTPKPPAAPETPEVPEAPEALKGAD